MGFERYLTKITIIEKVDARLSSSGIVRIGRFIFRINTYPQRSIDSEYLTIKQRVFQTHFRDKVVSKPTHGIQIQFGNPVKGDFE